MKWNECWLAGNRRRSRGYWLLVNTVALTCWKQQDKQPLIIKDRFKKKPTCEVTALDDTSETAVTVKLSQRSVTLAVPCAAWRTRRAIYVCKKPMQKGWGAFISLWDCILATPFKSSSLCAAGVGGGAFCDHQWNYANIHFNLGQQRRSERKTAGTGLIWEWNPGAESIYLFIF